MITWIIKREGLKLAFIRASARPSFVLRLLIVPPVSISVPPSFKAQSFTQLHKTSSFLHLCAPPCTCEHPCAEKRKNLKWCTNRTYVHIRISCTYLHQLAEKKCAEIC